MVIAAPSRGDVNCLLAAFRCLEHLAHERFGFEEKVPHPRLVTGRLVNRLEILQEEFGNQKNVIKRRHYDDVEEVIYVETWEEMKG